MIKFVYFDVGGVVVTDFSGTSKWDEMMNDIGVKPNQFEKFKNYFDLNENKFCSGFDIEKIIPVLNKEFNLNPPKNYSLLNDFTDRFEENESIWSVIEKAKAKHKIGLLTNMYPRMLDLIKQRGLLPKVEWDAVIDSSIEGVTKPQKEIFLLAQDRAGVNANEILFVENSKSHIVAAKKLGWQTFLYDSSNKEKASKKLELILK